MTYKKNMEWDREKKIHKVVKGGRVDKHRKYIYNMLSDVESDNDVVPENVGYGYHGNSNFNKRR